MNASPNKVLVDTNVWIAFFRKTRGDETSQQVGTVLDGLLVEDRVVLSGVVEMELLHGVKEHERGELEVLLEALPYVEASRQDFRRAGELLNNLRRRGITIPTPDALLAAQCLRQNFQLLENDKHFAEIKGLQRVAWREAP